MSKEGSIVAALPDVEEFDGGFGSSSSARASSPSRPDELDLVETDELLSLRCSSKDIWYCLKKSFGHE